MRRTAGPRDPTDGRPVDPPVAPRRDRLAVCRPRRRPAGRRWPRSSGCCSLVQDPRASSAGSRRPGARGPDLENYATCSTGSNFPQYFVNSALVALLVTARATCVLLDGRLRPGEARFAGKRLLFVLVLGTLMVPGMVTFVPQFVLVSNLGLVNTYAGLVLPFLVAPFGVFLMRQFMLAIPDDLLEAARVDGAGEFRIFWRIVLPLCGPALATLGILTFSAPGTTSSGRWWWPRPRTSTPCRWPWRCTPSARTAPNYGLLLAGAVVVVVPGARLFLACSATSCVASPRPASNEPRRSRPGRGRAAATSPLPGRSWTPGRRRPPVPAATRSPCPGAGARRDRVRRAPRRAPDGPFEVVDHGGGDVLAVPHPPYADTTGSRAGPTGTRSAPLATVNAIGPLSRPVPAASGGGRDGDGGRRRGAAAGGPLHRPWRAMVGSEHLSHLLSADRTGGRPIGAELPEALRRVRDELGVAVGPRARHPLRRPRRVPGGRRAAGGTTSPAWTGCTTRSGRWACGRWSSWRFMPRDLARDPTRTVFAYRGSSRRRRTGTAGRTWSRAHRAPGRPLRPATRCATTGPSRCGTRPTCRCSGPARRRSTGGCTRCPPARSRTVDPGIRVGGPASAAVGWIDDQLRSRTRRWTSCPPTPTAARRWTCARPRPTAGRTCSGGRSGGSPHPRQRHQRHRVRRGVPAARHALGGRPGGGAGAVGGLGPLRGAGPAAAAAARRVRPADRRQPGQAQVLGAALWRSGSATPSCR